MSTKSCFFFVFLKDGKPFDYTSNKGSSTQFYEASIYDMLDYTI